MTIQQKVTGAIRIFRPELPFAAGLCVVIGELLAMSAFPPLRSLGLGFLSGFFLSGSALILNDYFDLEVDRINAPERPLPAGILSPAEVIGLGVASALAGLAAAWAFGLTALGFSLVVWVLGFLYNWKFKQAGLWGNLIVSASVGATFILGGIIVGRVESRLIWVFALIVFLFDLAEEIAGDAMDAEGDRVRGSKSVAILKGRRAALNLSGALFGLVILLTFVPVAWGMLGALYLVTVVIMDLLIIYFGVKLVRDRSEAEGRRAMRGLYLSASLGFLAFFIGSFFA